LTACWNISCSTFIHKKGDINNCDNYRCQGLTSCFGKLFTSLLQNRLHRVLDDENLYNRFQAGFRPDYRTNDNKFTIKTILNKYLYKNKKQVFACFVDFSKESKISQQPENCENRDDPDLVQAFLRKWWVESDFKAPNLPLSLRFKGSGCHYNSI
jgi:hypothetical protein